jgi:hypothetical protein
MRRAAELPVWVSALALGVTVLADAGDAGACLNSVEEERRYNAQFEPPARIAKADRALEHGRHAAASAEVLSVYPRIRALDARTASPIERRALRVLALATVRAQGTSADRWPRAGNLEWAAVTLGEIEEARQHEPAARADHAEALAALPREHGRALAILEELDRRDLMGSLNAYLALARLRLERGDEGGAHAAVRRCHAMSTAHDKCALPPLPAARG